MAENLRKYVSVREEIIEPKNYSHALLRSIDPGDARGKSLVSHVEMRKHVFARG